MRWEGVAEEEVRHEEDIQAKEGGTLEDCKAKKQAGTVAMTKKRADTREAGTTSSS